jgi:CDP-diacylglycerol--glycerol-3-phosphate 3-phosphatidyltransferase
VIHTISGVGGYLRRWDFRILASNAQNKPIDYVETSKNIDGKVIEVKKDLFTVSNLVSFSRMLVPIPLAFMGPPDGTPDLLFTLLVAWAILSDFLDGWIARWMNQVSELGKVLDPIADKVCAALLFIYAVWVGRIPSWFLAALLGRDVLILLGSWFILSKHRKVAMSVMSGKVTVNLLAILWIVVMYFPNMVSLATFLMGLSLLMMVYSTSEYVWRYLQIRDGASYN